MDAKVVNSSKAVADLKVKLKAAKKRADDVAYKNDCLQARLQQSLPIQSKVCERIAATQGVI